MTNKPDDAAEVEVKAPSVAEAIQKGLIQLGATRDDVKIEILNEGSRGILGILGAEEAHVRLRLRRPPVRQPQPEPKAAPTEVAEPMMTEKEKVPTTDAEEPSPEPEREEALPDVPDEDAAEIALDTVRTLVDKIGASANVEFRQRGHGTSDHPVIIDVKGDNLGALIGHQGSSLQAFQYITRLIVSRQTHEWTNIVVDVDGYRQRRERTLRDLAERMADRVRERGRPISLEPMPPNERRIIHLALHDDPDVTTRSVGQDDNRKVTIRPRS